MSWFFKKRIAEEEKGEKKKKKRLIGFNKIIAVILMSIILIGALTVTFLGMYIGGSVSYLWYRFIERLTWFLFISGFTYLLFGLLLGFILPKPTFEYQLEDGSNGWRFVFSNPLNGQEYFFKSRFHRPIQIHKDYVSVTRSLGFFTHYTTNRPMRVNRTDKGYLRFDTKFRLSEKVELDHDRIVELEGENKLLRRKIATIMREFKLEKEVVEKKREEK